MEGYWRKEREMVLRQAQMPTTSHSKRKRERDLDHQSRAVDDKTVTTPLPSETLYCGDALRWTQIYVCVCILVLPTSSTSAALFLSLLLVLGRQLYCPGGAHPLCTLFYNVRALPPSLAGLSVSSDLCARRSRPMTHLLAMFERAVLLRRRMPVE